MKHVLRHVHKKKENWKRLEGLIPIIRELEEIGGDLRVF